MFAAFPMAIGPNNMLDLATAIAQAAACPPGAAAAAACGKRAAVRKPSPAPAAKPKPAAPAAVPAHLDVLALATPTGWTYSLDLPGRDGAAVDVEVAASSDAGGAPRVLLTAPAVAAAGGRRARPELHIGFDLERDADVHTVRAEARDGELVIAVARVEAAAPLKIKVAVATPGVDGARTAGAAAPPDGAVVEGRAPAAAAAADDDDGSWVEDGTDGEGSAKGGAPKKGGAVLEAVADDDA